MKRFDRLSKNWKIVILLLGFIVGYAIAFGLYHIVIEPQMPYLVLDKTHPIQNDILGIGYYPIELTGAKEGTNYYACIVPSVYEGYLHNVPTNYWHPFNPHGFILSNSGILLLIVSVFVISWIGLDIYKTYKKKIKEIK